MIFELSKNKKNKERTEKRGQGKRGQITVFIIIAIIILFTVAFVIYIRSGITKVRPTVSQLEVTEDVKPIQTYVTDCLNIVSKDALVKLGNNGGYININNMHISPIPYQSDVLVFEPQKIPYWYYLKTDCDNPSNPLGCIQTNRPPACKSGVQCAIDSNGPNSMEEQLNTYIAQNINNCINNFDAFKDRYDIKTGNVADINVESTLTDSSVAFKMNYPLDITVKGTSKNEKIPYFYTEQQVKLKEMYNFATDIYTAEAKYNFLETSTMNLIAAYSGVDQNLLPPTSGVELFVAGKKYWVRSDVANTLKNDVLPYMNFMQIVNSGNANTIYDNVRDPKYMQFSDGLYRSMAVKVSNTSYFDINANVIYPYSDIYLNIGNSEIIKPQSLDSGGNPLLQMVGFFLNNYNFKYDISYPVIVRLEDPSAFNGEGYTFDFAMEANIRQNTAVKGNITVINANSLNTLDTNSELQRVNRTIHIETYDKHTNKPVDGVVVYYRCGSQYLVGDTALTVDKKKAVLESTFPYCPVGGQIIYEKGGYMGGGLDYNNDEINTAISNSPVAFKMGIWPLQEKNIQVYKRTPSNVESIVKRGAGAITLYGSAVTDISNNESVMISLSRHKENSLVSDVPVVGFLVYKNQSSNSRTDVISIDDQKSQIMKLFNDGKIDGATKDQMFSDLEDLQNSIMQNNKTIPGSALADANTENSDYKLDFVPGTYSSDLFMIYNNNIHIPAETRSICPLPRVLGVCITGEKTIDLPEQDFDSWINGGSNIDFTLSENDVYSNSTLVLYVLEMPIPTNWDMMQNYQAPQQYQQGKTFLLKPKLQ